MSSATPTGLSPGQFRLGLALIVVFDHFSGVMIGRSAVYIFFALSGFWITRMWAERYSQVYRPYLTFVVSRFWRLVPTMLFASILAALMFASVSAQTPLTMAPDEIGHLVFSSVFFLGYAELASPRLVEPAWSLDIEMRFYLIAPVLAVILRSYGVRWFMALAIGCAVIGFVAPFLGIKYLIWFAIGMAAGHVQWRPSTLLSATSLAGFVSALILAYTLNPDLLVDPQLRDANGTLNWTLAALAIPYAISTCSSTTDRRDRMFGDLSYTVYLVHWPIFAMLVVTETISALSILVALIAVAMLSYGFFAIVDHPLQKARARWVSSRAAHLDPVPSRA